MEINWRLTIDSKVHVIITCTFESIINLIIAHYLFPRPFRSNVCSSLSEPQSVS